MNISNRDKYTSVLVRYKDRNKNKNYLKVI